MEGAERVLFSGTRDDEDDGTLTDMEDSDLNRLAEELYDPYYVDRLRGDSGTILYKEETRTLER